MKDMGMTGLASAWVKNCDRDSRWFLASPPHLILLRAGILMLAGAPAHAELDPCGFMATSSAGDAKLLLAPRLSGQSSESRDLSRCTRQGLHCSGGVELET